MIIRLSILGRNDSYMKRLLDFCRADYADKLELSCFSEITPITINLDRKAGQPVRLSLHLVPKLQ